MTDHDTIQIQLLEGTHNDDVDEHLATCDECLQVAEALSAVRSNAPQIGGRAPSGLADRVIDELRREGMGSPDRFRRSVHRSLAVAAAMLLLVGAVAILNQGNEDEPLEVLLASAQRTQEAGPAEASVTGTATLTVVTPDDPGERPDLSSVPPALHDHVQDRVDEIMVRWEQHMAEFEARVNATLENADRLINDRVDRMFEQFGEGSGASPPPPPPPSPHSSAPPEAGEPPAEDPPAPPADLTFGFDISASGHLDPGRAINLEGGVTSDGGGRSSFEVRGRTERAGVLVDGAWRAADSGGRVLDTVLTRTDGVPAVLRAAVSAEMVGEAEIDGTSVRRYRFTVDPSRIDGRADSDAGSAAGGWTGEAWIDGDDLLRRLEVNAAGHFDRTRTTGWDMGLRVDLSGFGSVAQLDVESPPAGASVEGRSSASVFGYFTPALAASLRGSATSG